MKRLGFWMVVGIVALNFAVHRHHRAHAQYQYAAERAASVSQVAFLQDGHPAPPPPPPRPSKKARPRPARPLPPSAPAAEPPKEAKVQPDWFPKDRGTPASVESKAPVVVQNPVNNTDQKRSVIVSAISSSEEKAKRDLDKRIAFEVDRWLVGDVGPNWKPPASAIQSLVIETYVQPVVEDLGEVSKDLDEMVTLYRAGALVDFSRTQHARLVAVHDQEVVRDRMLKGGGILAFALVTLASLAGYIRADEATRGSYTNRLRLLSAAGVGAAGVLIYQMFA